MIMKNKYCIRSRISEAKFREIIRFFAIDLTASQMASATKLNLNTINNILKNIRQSIAEVCEKESVFDKGEVKMNESYFGARRVRDLCGRGAKGKTIVFGLKKRKGKIYIQIIKNCSKNEILPPIKAKISKGSTVYTDGFKTYDGLVDMGYKKHYHVHHRKNEFSKREGKVKNHIKGTVHSSHSRFDSH